MQTCIALLRGINVSGQKKIQMSDLIALFRACGFTEVRSYIQSGNIIFNAGSGVPVGELEKIVEAEIAARYQFEVPVLVLTRPALQALADANPFLSESDIDPDKLHVTFLSSEVSAEASDIDKHAYLPDRFFTAGKAVYLYCPSGYGRTKLNNSFFERKYKVKASTRNWRTVNTLLALAAA